MSHTQHNMTDIGDMISNVVICRLCAEAEMTTAKSFIPLFTDDKKEFDVTKQLNQLISNLVSPNDGLPQDICLICAEKVTSYYEFVNSIIATQNRLRRLMMLPELEKLGHVPSQNEIQFLKDENNVEIPVDIIKNQFLSPSSLPDIQAPNSHTMFSDLDNFVELLVVQPNEMVQLNLQHILKSQDLTDQTMIISSTNGQPLCVTPENEQLMPEPTDTLKELKVADDDVFGVKKVRLLQMKPSDFLGIDEYEVLFDRNDEDEISYHNSEGFSDPLNSPTNTSHAKQSYFYCCICHEQFESELVLRFHLNQHRLCTTCNMCFATAEALINHINLHHPNELIKTVEELEVVQDADKKIQSDIYDQSTDNLSEHKLRHSTQHSEYSKKSSSPSLKKWFYCEFCQKKIFSEGNFMFHVARHQGADTVRCKHCDYTAQNVQDYNIHLTVHTGGKYYMCNDCDKCFFTRSAITDHVLLHMEGTRYMCEICGKRFKTSRSNAQHKLLQHKKYFRCSRCNRGFTRQEKLEAHFNICQAISSDQFDPNVFQVVERFFCNICNTNIRSTSEISILFHQARHEGKEGVECKFCLSLCKNAFMYKNHLLMHTNQRPFACNQCPKSFRTKGCLVQHMLVHGDEFKYVCDYCGKKSKKLTTHVNHVNIHTGTKPYTCPDCERPFRQLSDMKKHRKTHLRSIIKVEEAETVMVPIAYAVEGDVDDLIGTEITTIDKFEYT